MIAVRSARPNEINGHHRPGDYTGHASVLVQHGSFTYTIADEIDRPLAMVGLVVRWEGVADVWAVFTDLARGRGLAVTRRAQDLLMRHAFELRLRRIGCMVRDDRVEYKRWIELLGFEYEGVEREATFDGVDIWRYVKWISPRAAAQ